MKSSYKKIGAYVEQINIRNKDFSVTDLQGININKFFMPSVANTNGTDLSKYKVVKHKQFAFNPMHVGRDEILPISILENLKSVIVSPAYVVFKIKDESQLLPDYLMMWCRRPEFDRNAWFTTDSSVRGGFSWKDFCDLTLPVPAIEKQREIVREYQTIIDLIKLNENFNQKLEETAKTIYRQWFVDFEFPISEKYAAESGNPEMVGKPYKSSGGKMVLNEELNIEIPEGWNPMVLGNICTLVTKGTTPQTMFDQKNEGLISFIKGESINNLHSINESILSYVDEETHVGFLKRSILKEGDILFTIAGTLGKFAILNKRVLPANINQAVAIIRISNNEEYRCIMIGLLLSGLHKKFYTKNIQQAVQANYSLTTIKSLPILLPDNSSIKTISVMTKSLIDIIQLKNVYIELLKTLANTILSKMSKLEVI